MQLSMYMKLTTNATTQKALPAHSLITFTTFGYKSRFPPRLLSLTSKKIKEKERRFQIKSQIFSNFFHLAENST